MTKKYKDNVIPFPNKKDYVEEKLKESRETVQWMTAESVDTAVYMLEIMENELKAMQGNLFHNVDFRDPEKPEARDMHAIVNLLNAMFMRYVGIPHDLQQQLDTVYVKSKAMEQFKDDEEEEEIEYEIEFIPDFDLDGDDDDNS